eukprot:6213231-Pleurochrysis_carterae.AAC.5
MRTGSRICRCVILGVRSFVTSGTAICCEFILCCCSVSDGEVEDDVVSGNPTRINALFVALLFVPLMSDFCASTVSIRASSINLLLLDPAAAAVLPSPA